MLAIFFSIVYNKFYEMNEEKGGYHMPQYETKIIMRYINEIIDEEELTPEQKISIISKVAKKTLDEEK